MSESLPENWVQAPLKELILPTETINPISERQGNIRYIDIESVDNKRQEIANPKSIPSSEAPSRARRKVHLGDVIFSLVRPYLKNLAIIPQELDGEVASTAFFVSRLGTGVKSEWLYRHLQRDGVINALPTVGNSPPATRDIDFEEHCVPIAPTKEQQRILSVLEPTLAKIDEAEEALERVRRNLDRYRASVLKAACEGRLVPTEAELARQQGRDYEPASQLLKRILIARREAWEKAQIETYTKKGKTPPKDWKSRYPEPQAPNTSDLPELPEGWCWASVDQMVNLVGTGATPERGNPRYWDGGAIAWVTSSCVNSETVTEAYEFITEAAIAETNAKTFEPGTLLLAMYGEGKTRGKVTELRICAATNQACASLVFSTYNHLLSGYLKIYLKNNYESMRRLASGGVQPNLNISMIRSLVVPMPPFQEQLRIVIEESRIASFLHEVTISLGANSKACHTLRQSLLKHAFSGKLVPQDPADEPASVLLERIRAQRRELEGGTTPRKRAIRKTKKSS